MDILAIVQYKSIVKRSFNRIENCIIYNQILSLRTRTFLKSCKAKVITRVVEENLRFSTILQVTFLVVIFLFVVYYYVFTIDNQST